MRSFIKLASLGAVICLLGYPVKMWAQDSNADSTLIQEPKNAVWQWGFMGGLHFSTIEGDLSDQTYIPDFHAGVYGETDIFPPLGFRVELYYASLGTGFASVADSRLKLNYLVLPGMFTYEFRPGMSFLLGPYIGYLIKANDKGDDYKEDITESLARVDVGIKIGVYFQVSPVVNLGVAFHRGFINTQSGGRVSTLKQYNQAVMFTTSFKITELINR